MSRTDEIARRFQEVEFSPRDVLGHAVLETGVEVSFYAADIEHLLNENKRLREVIEKAADHADKGYETAELEAGVYTIDQDDFYACVGFVRDILCQALEEE